MQPVIQQVTQGLSAEKLALTMAIGFVIAVIPLVGVTTVLCTVAAIMLRLNQPVIQAINYFSAPLQILCLLPFFRAGEWVFNEPPLSMGPMQIVQFLTTEPLNAISLLFTTTWHALVVWLAVSPVLGLVIYFCMIPVLRLAAGRFRRQPLPDGELLDAG